MKSSVWGEKQRMVGAGTVVVRGGTEWWSASVLGGGRSDLVPLVAFGRLIFGWWALSVQSACGVRRVRSPMVVLGVESGW
jgi:hypothetical protein